MISISQSDIFRTLKKIGIKEGDSVLVHSSIGLMFGVQSNPSQLLYSSIREIIKDSGTIIAPTFTFSSCQGKVFDITQTQSEVGDFSNYVLSLKDSFRSFHPIHSVAAVGPNAEYICNHESPSSFGKNSSYNKIIDFNVHVLLIGVGINYLSLIHQVEEDLSVPYRFYKEFDIKVRENKSYKYLKVPYFARYLDRVTEYDYIKREAALLDSNTFQEIKLGWGVIKYGYAKKIYDILFEKVQYEPFFLINKSKYFEK
jgi:aminoglycoside 3-N-acetyltransferase